MEYETEATTQIAEGKQPNTATLKFLDLLDRNSTAMKEVLKKKRYVDKLEYTNYLHGKKWKHWTGCIFPVAMLGAIGILTATLLLKIYNLWPFISSVLLIFIGFLGMLGLLDLIDSFHDLEINKLNPKSSRLIKAYHKGHEKYEATTKPYREQLNDQSTQLEILLKLGDIRKTIPQHRLQDFDRYVSPFERNLQCQNFDIAFSYIVMLIEVIEKWKKEPAKNNEEHTISYVEMLKNVTGYTKPKKNIASLL